MKKLVFMTLIAAMLIFSASSSMAILEGEGYNFDETKGELTVLSNEGCVNWKNAGISSADILSLRIGENVTDIAQYAFMSCTRLQTVSIASTVSNIYEYAFYNCPVSLE